jgi:hypothetical protein
VTTVEDVLNHRSHHRRAEDVDTNRALWKLRLRRREDRPLSVEGRVISSSPPKRSPPIVTRAPSV